MLSRRVLLGGAAGVTAVIVVDLVVGPGHGHHAARRPVPRPSGPPDPAVAAAVAEERVLIAAYESAVAALPELAGTLAVPLAHHRDHLAALTDGAAPTPTALPATPTPAPGTAAVFAARRDALLGLRAQEQATSAARVTAAGTDLASGGLLASIAAADAVHVDLLDAAVAALAGPPAPPSTSAPPPTTPVRTPARTPTPRPTPTPTPPPTPTTSVTAPATPSTIPTPS